MNISQRRLRAIFALILTVFSALALFAIAQKSLSNDEHAHLAAGFAMWKTGNDHLNPEHPPLVKLLGSLPLYFSSPSTDVTMVPGYLEGDQWTFAKSLLYRSSPPIAVDHVVFMGRSLCFFFGLALLTAIFFFSKMLWGNAGALFSLLLAALCPNFIAHAPLIHTDIAVTLGFVLTTWRAYRFEQNPTRRHAILLALALGFAMAAKFSGVLLIPFVAWVFVHSLARSDRNLAAQNFSLMFLVTVLIISLPYGGVFEIGKYFQGLFSVYGNHVGQDYSYFMAGRYDPDGFFFYYPIALLLKTPLPSLAAIFLAIYFARKPEKRIFLFLAIPAALPLIAGAVARHNIGVRHAFPTLALLYVVAGALTVHAPKRLRLALPAALIVLLAVESLRFFPSSFSYFNQFAGGPRGGVHFLDDSNVDWGLDLKRLPKRLADLGMSTIKLDYFGLEPFSHRQIDAQKMTVFDRYFPLGDCVVSVHWLQRKPLIPLFADYSYDWLAAYEPASILGYSLYIYRFRLGEARGFQDGIQTFEKKEWLQTGISRLHLLLAKNPKFYHGLLALGEAYALAGQAPEARRMLSRAASFNTLDPEDPFRKTADHLARNGFHKEAESVRRLLQIDETAPSAP